MSERTSDKRLWLGLVLILIGGVFLIDNLHFPGFRIPWFFFTWEMLFLVIGFAMLITGRRAGFIFILIGGFFMLERMHWFPFWIDDLFWPLVLIICGLYFIVRRSHSSQQRDNDNNFLDEVSIFSGGDRIVTSDKFTGGKVTSIFGGAEINLQGAKLANEETVIDVFTLFGGSEFIVPPTMNVKIKVFSIFGAFSDNRRGAIDAEIDQSKALVIKGFVCFGGGEVQTK